MLVCVMRLCVVAHTRVCMRACPRLHVQGYRFTANMPGTYAFCMDNRMARWTAKVVTFELDVRRNALDGAPVVNRDVVAPVAPAAGEGSAEGSAEPAHVSMMQAVSRIRARLLVVENGQYY
ncbi:emp24/gp25L/p24 family protein, partial [archaeon]